MSTPSFGPDECSSSSISNWGALGGIRPVRKDCSPKNANGLVCAPGLARWVQRLMPSRTQVFCLIHARPAPSRPFYDRGHGGQN